MTELVLPPHVDLEAAQEIKEAATKAAEVGLKLIADQVATVSCAGLQTIIAANRHLEVSGNAIVLEAPSPSFAAAFESLGFAEEFNKLKVEQ